MNVGFFDLGGTGKTGAQGMAAEDALAFTFGYINTHAGLGGKDTTTSRRVSMLPLLANIGFAASRIADLLFGAQSVKSPP